MFTLLNLSHSVHSEMESIRLLSQAKETWQTVGEEKEIKAKNLNRRHINIFCTNMAEPRICQ